MLFILPTTLSAGIFVVADTMFAKAEKAGFSIVKPIFSIAPSLNASVCIPPYSFLNLDPIVGDRFAKASIVLA